MYKEILTANQLDLLPLLKSFSKDYYLVGGTAIALQINHRRSIDFDLFTDEDVKRNRVKNKIKQMDFIIQETLYEAFDQLHVHRYKCFHGPTLTENFQ